MTPDLGAYAAEVTLAYAGTILALGLLVWLSVRQARGARREMEEAEARAKNA